MVRLSALWMRDPFLLSTHDVGDAASGAQGLPASDARRKRFWLYGTTDKPPKSLGNPYAEFPATGFDCYCSDDLIEWEGPFAAFRRPEGYWADTQFWAPEVYLFNGRLVMFATMKKTGKSNERGVTVLESPQGRPEGPFLPLVNGPITPANWACLDGTLHVQDGTPYMVFCREWTQVGDGQMCAQVLAPDLRGTNGPPEVLFSASQAPWSKKFNSTSSQHASNFITDGPYLHRCETSGELVMLWSSIGLNDKYCVGVSRSTSRSVKGPWVHDAEPLFHHDGGHAMMTQVLHGRGALVSTAGGQAPQSHGLIVLALHSPNRQVLESAPRLMGILEERDKTTGLARFSVFDFMP